MPNFVETFMDLQGLETLQGVWSDYAKPNALLPHVKGSEKLTGLLTAGDPHGHVANTYTDRRPCASSTPSLTTNLRAPGPAN